MKPSKKTDPTNPSRRKASQPPPLKESAAQAIDHFLATLDGEPCSDLYQMVIFQVEEPLLRAALSYTQHNQSQTAAMLGLNRGTLRKKLRQHGLLSERPSRKSKRNPRPHRQRKR